MNLKKKGSSRRSLLRLSGTLFAASSAAPLLSAAGDQKANPAELPARHVLEGSPIHMDEGQLQALKREMASVRKTVARLREVKLRNGDEPATIFRA